MNELNMSELAESLRKAGEELRKYPLSLKLEDLEQMIELFNKTGD